MYYNKRGEEIDIMEWTELTEDEEYRKIKQENVGKYFISTVWIGLNHNFGDGEPLIFETMVFGGKESDLDMDRYSTLKEAEKGHKKIVKKWSKK